ncbi:hypothetical protein DL93DRAFT_2044281, partial [Clavulina sp. PMI_390]
GAARLFQIAVTKAAFVIWKLRNQRTPTNSRDDNQRDRKTEALRAYAKILNKRISDNQQMMHKIKYGNCALTCGIVLSTWSSVIRDKAHLPPDWIGHHGVL